MGFLEQATKASLPAKSLDGQLYGLNIFISDLDIASPQNMIFKTGDKEVFIYRCLSVLGGVVSLIFYENPNVSAYGTPVNAYCKNRPKNDKKPASKVWTGNTATGGTQCFEPSYALGSTSVLSMSGSSIQPGTPRILRRNTIYYGVFTTDTDNTKVNYNLEFYEV